MSLMCASSKSYQKVKKSQRKATGSKRKKDLESAGGNSCKIRKHTPCRCLWSNTSAWGHSPIQNNDAYTADEYNPSHIDLSDTGSVTAQSSGCRFCTRLLQAPKLTVTSEIMVFLYIYDLQLYGNLTKVIALICEHVIL